MEFVGGNFRLQPANEKGYDLFGQVEFYVARQIKGSGKTIHFAVSAAELSLRIKNGRSVRSSWFRDQSADQTIEVSVVDKQSIEVGADFSTSGDVNLSAETLLPSASAKGSRGTKRVTKQETQRTYSVSTATIIATGSTEEPIWTINPPQGMDFVIGRLPSEETRITRIVPESIAKTLYVQPVVYLEHQRAWISSLGDGRGDANRRIHANALLRKLFRRTRYSTATLPKISRRSDVSPKEK